MLRYLGRTAPGGCLSARYVAGHRRFGRPQSRTRRGRDRGRDQPAILRSRICRRPSSSPAPPPAWGGPRSASSPPKGGTSDVIYRAVIDPDPTAVRYYSAPDSASIPRAKRILGADGYWQEVRRSVPRHPSELWKTLMARPGGTPVDMEV